MPRFDLVVDSLREISISFRAEKLVSEEGGKVFLRDTLSDIDGYQSFKVNRVLTRINKPWQP